MDQVTWRKLFHRASSAVSRLAWTRRWGMKRRWLGVMTRRTGKQEHWSPIRADDPVGPKPSYFMAWAKCKKCRLHHQEPVSVNVPVEYDKHNNQIPLVIECDRCMRVRIGELQYERWMRIKRKMVRLCERG
jgi:hypothetical protein